MRYIYFLLVLMFTGFFISACGSGGSTGKWDGSGDPGGSGETVSIVVTPATSSVPMGATRQLVATATFADGTSRVVTEEGIWTSGTPAVATVNSVSGLATGVSVGSTLITATYNGKSSSVTLNVTAATLNSIVVTPATASVPIGLTQTFVATGAYSDGTSHNLSNSAVWSSSNEQFATVVSPGIATGLSVGTPSITATFGGQSGSAALTVTDVALSSIAVTPATSSVAMGVTQQFVATATFADGSSRVVTEGANWISDAPAIATVNSASGLATGVTSGNALITATFGGESDSATLTVTAATLNLITVTPETALIPNGLTQTFVATGAYSDGTNQNLSDSVTWSSDAVDVATVVSPGIATGLSVGSAQIIATLNDESGSATLNVTAATLESIEVLPVQATIAVNGSITFVAMGTYSDSTTPIDISDSVIWSSDAVDVATVISSTGLATGLSAGTALIKATVADTLPLMEGTSELTVTADPVVNLASAATYGTFGGSAGMTNTGVQTVIHGDIGTIATDTTAITGFQDDTNIYTVTLANDGDVTGDINTCAPPTNTGLVDSIKCDFAIQARLDAEQAYIALRDMPSGGVLAGNLAGTTITAGVYTNASSVLIQGGDLTLHGTANDVWVFQIGTTLTVGGPGADFPQSIILTGGALPKNVFWQVGTSATINAGGGGTMVGTIIAQDGVSFSTAGNTNVVTLNGRALSLGASVTMVDTVINVPAP